MFERKWLTAIMAVLVVGSAGLAGAATGGTTDAQAQTSSSGYASTHVSTNASGNALVDYTVDGTTVAESVRVQSASEVEADAGLGFDGSLDGLSGFAGAQLSAQSSTETSAAFSTESGAEVVAHDNGHGSLVVVAGGESQYVGLNVSSSASAESESDERVVVTHEDGSKSTILVAGDGSVTVNDEGNVTAKVDGQSRLVVRSYEDRDEDVEQQEEMIVNGTAAAQVYLTEQAEDGSQAAVDIVDYGQNTTVEVTQKTEGKVAMTAERAESHGKVVITSVSEAVFDSAEDVQVQVDGEAAVEASSYSELAAATDDGDSSKFMATQSANADASVDVAVALNHFSEHSVTMSDGSGDTDDGSGSGTDDGSGTAGTSTDDGSGSAGSGSDDSSSGSGSDGSSGSGGSTATPGQNGPGFTAVMALLAVAAALGIASRRD